jgi:hypothetical protein
MVEVTNSQWIWQPITPLLREMPWGKGGGGWGLCPAGWTALAGGGNPWTGMAGGGNPWNGWTCWIGGGTALATGCGIAIGIVHGIGLGNGTVNLALCNWTVGGADAAKLELAFGGCWKTDWMVCKVAPSG